MVSPKNVCVRLNLRKMKYFSPMYRERNEPSRVAQIYATIIGTFMWTWILLGFYYESDHITVS